MVYEVTNAHLVAAAKELFITLIPDCEGKIANKTFWRVFTPFFICLQNQSAVGKIDAFGLRYPQRLKEVISIIKPSIGSNG